MLLRRVTRTMTRVTLFRNLDFSMRTEGLKWTMDTYLSRVLSAICSCLVSVVLSLVIHPISEETNVIICLQHQACLYQLEHWHILGMD
jgi:hypothetical protein